MNRRKPRIIKKTMRPNPSKILRLFAEVEDRLYDSYTVKNAISQICRHTKDQALIRICQSIADVLEIEFDKNFEYIDTNKHFEAVHRLQKHHKFVLDKYQEITNCIGDYNPKWTDNLIKIIDTQIARLSQLIILLDREPDICDKYGQEIRPNDLVIYPCKDEKDRDYEHYGVVRATPNGYSVAHFFTGKTVKPESRIVEVGVGYVNFTPYTPDWIFKERPASISDSQIEAHIKASMEKIISANDELWNKLRYNCEHWAREMVYAQPECTQNPRKSVK